jgi:hypothetical protein
MTEPLGLCYPRPTQTSRRVRRSHRRRLARSDQSMSRHDPPLPEYASSGVGEVPIETAAKPIERQRQYWLACDGAPDQAARWTAAKKPLSEGWWFVGGGAPGSLLASLFGVEFVALAAFGGDAVAAVLIAGLLAARHHHRPIRLRCLQ